MSILLKTYNIEPENSIESEERNWNRKEAKVIQSLVFAAVRSKSLIIVIFLTAIKVSILHFVKDESILKHSHKDTRLTPYHPYFKNAENFSTKALVENKCHLQIDDVHLLYDRQKLRPSSD